MTSTGIIVMLFLLFIVLYAGIRKGLARWQAVLERNKQLHIYQERGNSRWSSVGTSIFVARATIFSRIDRHLTDVLLALRWRMQPDGFIICSLMMGAGGIAAGLLLFQSARAIVLLLLLMGSLPYLLLRMSLINRQMATRLDLLPGIELFYQSYLLMGNGQIRMALQRMIEERRLAGEVQLVFEQLSRQLSVHEGYEASLRRFALSFGNVWADYFSSILKVALEEGNNVTENLKELIADMRQSQLSNQLERHRLLEIRLANFTPVLFLAVFLGINFRLNPEGSYMYYVMDPTGRGMLLNAIVLIFLSFLMGLYLSKRKL